MTRLVAVADVFLGGRVGRYLTGLCLTCIARHGLACIARREHLFEKSMGRDGNGAGGQRDGNRSIGKSVATVAREFVVLIRREQL